VRRQTRGYLPSRGASSPFDRYQCILLGDRCTRVPILTRKPASADKTARRQFQVVFPVIAGSFTTNVIVHLHGLSMDLTVGRTVGPTVDSTVG